MLMSAPVEPCVKCDRTDYDGLLSEWGWCLRCEYENKQWREDDE